MLCTQNSDCSVGMGELKIKTHKRYDALILNDNDSLTYLGDNFFKKCINIHYMAYKCLILSASQFCSLNPNNSSQMIPPPSITFSAQSFLFNLRQNVLFLQLILTPAL